MAFLMGYRNWGPMRHATSSAQCASLKLPAQAVSAAAATAVAAAAGPCGYLP